MDLLNDIEFLIWRFKVFNSERTFVEMKFDVCKFFTNPRGQFLINQLKNYYVKHYNPKFMTCPIKKGSYMVAGSREVVQDVNDVIPLFVEKRGNITISTAAYTKVGKKMMKIGTVSEMFEFYST